MGMSWNMEITSILENYVYPSPYGDELKSSEVYTDTHLQLFPSPYGDELKLKNAFDMVKDQLYPSPYEDELK